MKDLEAQVTQLESDLVAAKKASSIDAIALEEARGLHASHAEQLKAALDQHAQHAEDVEQIKSAHALQLGSQKDGSDKAIEARLSDIQAESAVELGKAIAELNTVHEAGFRELVKQHHAAT